MEGIEYRDLVDFPLPHMMSNFYAGKADADLTRISGFGPLAKRQKCSIFRHLRIG